MLDSETKRRIDTARDILVGKIPDPKSQIEQITIALIYKFMDDMDKKSEELGGKVKFFTGDYSKYSWSKLLDASLSGFELVNVYGESIASMNQNPNLPQLFRDIFKNAYLPYRDPETLKAFLRIIDDFKYDHSERLGDAFEYLLSVMGSQGDAGQFRTPRHIIEFIVDVVDPSVNDTILDPACGTAGFLISAYKHILEKNMKDGRIDLSPTDRKKLVENVVGYDISPDMVRLSLVNLYLHGFKNPSIYEYDTLTSDEKWDETFDICLANPPFMTPKGGIRPHKRFSVSSNRAEVLFVDYMAEHLNNDGKAGIIVPEGIIFQSGSAYKNLRKMLLDNSLYAVVSLPAGVFNPYSGVKTSILFLDKQIVKKTNDVLFVKVEADGYNLGAQRREIKQNDLPLALEILDDYKKAVLLGEEPKLENHENQRFSGSLEQKHSKLFEKTIAHIVSKEKIKENGYNLSGDRYKEEVVYDGKWDLVELGEVCEINPKKSDVRDEPKDLEVSFVPMSDINEHKMYFEPKQVKKLSEVYSGYTYFKDGDVLLARVTPCFENGKSGLAKKLKNGIGFGSSEYFVLRHSKKILPELVYYYISHNLFLEKGKSHMTGTGGLQRLTKDFLAKLKIPLPPIEVQERIVEEIENYQNIIDGAKKVVESYKPSFKIDKDWDLVELGELADFIRGPFGGSLKKEIFKDKGYLVYEQYHPINNDFSFARYYIDDEKFEEMKRFEVKSGDLLISCSGTMGKIAIVPQDHKKGIINQALLKLTANKDKIINIFLKYFLEMESIQKKYFSNQAGAAIQNVVSVKILKTMKIPLPPIKTQKEIVARIEEEQKLVDSNKKLIELFEKKVKDKIAEVWGE